jgi:hypothetical protein
MAPPVNPHLMTTRVKRGFRLPADRLTLSATSASTLSPVPSSVRATLVDPNWRRAMEEEFAALITNNTWDLVPRPVGSNVITESGISSTSSILMALLGTVQGSLGSSRLHPAT